jgi:pyridoxine 5-phosphate synthase
VSAFIEPRAEQVIACDDMGFHAIELWTGGYAHAKNAEQLKGRIKELTDSIAAGRRAGLLVHAGHGLTYQNVGTLAAMEGFEEFNIGHTIVSRALFVGMREAVSQMKALIS